VIAFAFLRRDLGAPREAIRISPRSIIPQISISSLGAYGCAPSSSRIKRLDEVVVCTRVEAGQLVSIMSWAVSMRRGVAARFFAQLAAQGNAVHAGQHHVGDLTS
jgi:hypothetical protein